MFRGDTRTAFSNAQQHQRCIKSPFDIKTLGRKFYLWIFLNNSCGPASIVSEICMRLVKAVMLVNICGAMSSLIVDRLGCFGATPTGCLEFGLAKICRLSRSSNPKTLLLYLLFATKAHTGQWIETHAGKWRRKRNTTRRSSKYRRFERPSSHSLIRFYPLCVLHYFSVILVIGQLCVRWTRQPGVGERGGERRCENLLPTASVQFR